MIGWGSRGSRGDALDSPLADRQPPTAITSAPAPRLRCPSQRFDSRLATRQGVPLRTPRQEEPMRYRFMLTVAVAAMLAPPRRPRADPRRRRGDVLPRVPAVPRRGPRLRRSRSARTAASRCGFGPMNLGRGGRPSSGARPARSSACFCAARQPRRRWPRRNLSESKRPTWSSGDRASAASQEELGAPPSRVGEAPRTQGRTGARGEALVRAAPRPIAKRAATPRGVQEKCP